MLNKITTHIGLFFFFIVNTLYSQTSNIFQQADNFVKDASFYSEKFITPSVDAVVYQASTSWMNSPRKSEFGTFTIALQGNVFFVPNKDRSFVVSQSDLSFFKIPNQQNSVEVPTALGGDSDVDFDGDFGGIPLSVSAPNGVNQDQVLHPFLQASFSLWKGFEIIGRYSTKINLKKGDFQIYGIGIKHNFSQYIDYLGANNINLAVLVSNSVEKINLDFIESNTQFLGDIGVGKITGDVKTWQFQLSGSKVWNKFELILSSITNVSDVKYYLSGDQSGFSQLLPIQTILNNELEKQYKTKVNGIGEVSGRYQINKFYIQSTLTFGRFANLNLGVQYEFK